MALHFRLRVNEETIGTFDAQRFEREVPDDGICTYDVIISNRHLKDTEVVIRHNYNDGAWTLIRKAIEAMEEMEK